MKSHSKEIGLLGFFGILLTLIGLGLGVFAAYEYFGDKKSPYSIAELIPAKDLSFFAFTNTKNFSSPEIVYIEEETKIQFSLEKIIVGYEMDGENFFAQITPHRKNQKNPKGMYCETHKKYQICAIEKKVVLLIADGILSGKKPLSLSQEFQDAMQQSSYDSAFRFFGSTKLLQKNLWKNFSKKIPNDEKEQSGIIFENITKNFSFFAGSFDKNAREIFFLSNTPQEKNFPATLSEFDISPEFFGDEIAQYIYIKRADFFWEKIFSSLKKENLAENFFLQSWAAEKTTFISEHIIDFNEDIFPLLGGDIILMKTKTGKLGLFLSLPSEKISKNLQEKIEKTLNIKQAKRSVLKAGHTVQSGETLYEIFPNTKNVSVETKTEKNAKFSVFTNSIANEEDGEEKFLGSVQKGSYILISSDIKLLENFWSLDGQKSSFILPNSSPEIFSSFGSLSSDENFPLQKIEGKAVEKKYGIYIYLQADWKDGYKYKKPAPELYEDDFSVEK